MARKVVDAGPHQGEISQARRDEVRTLRGRGGRTPAETNRLVDMLLDNQAALEARIQLLEGRR